MSGEKILQTGLELCHPHPPPPHSPPHRILFLPCPIEIKAASLVGLVSKLHLLVNFKVFAGPLMLKTCSKYPLPRWRRQKIFFRTIPTPLVHLGLKVSLFTEKVGFLQPKTGFLRLTLEIWDTFVDAFPISALCFLFLILFQLHLSSTFVSGGSLDRIFFWRCVF